MIKYFLKKTSLLFKDGCWIHLEEPLAADWIPLIRVVITVFLVIIPAIIFNYLQK